ncbi:hypothetical protein DV515_00012770, partial [Chloebia gouldiae]
PKVQRGAEIPRAARQQKALGAGNAEQTRLGQKALGAGNAEQTRLGQKALGAGNAEQTRLGQRSPSPVLCPTVTPCLPQRLPEEMRTAQYSGEVELPYSKTKAMAEKIVLEANGTKLSSGGTLRTCILHAHTVCGEKAAFLQELCVLARARDAVLNYLEPEDTKQDHTYVGNVAWMHVLAARQQQLKADLLAGQVYFCWDDTPG